MSKLPRYTFSEDYIEKYGFSGSPQVQIANRIAELIWLHLRKKGVCSGEINSEDVNLPDYYEVIVYNGLACIVINNFAVESEAEELESIGKNCVPHNYEVKMFCNI